MKKGDLFKCLAVLVGIAVFIGCSSDDGRIYYAVEQQGIVSGYTEAQIDTMEIDGKTAITIDEITEVKTSLFDAVMTATFAFKYHVDTTTGMYFYHESDIKQRMLHLGGKIEVFGDYLVATDNSSSISDTIEIAPDLILQNTLYFAHLIRDFADADADSIHYDLFSEIDNSIHKLIYFNPRIDSEKFAGREYRALKLDLIDKTLGLRGEIWIDTESKYLLKSDLPTRVVYLADRSIKKKVRDSNIDDLILTRANVQIGDIKSIKYMKVRAVIEPAGCWLTEEDLNVPGQKFEGTVVDNHIDGIFEISHERYDGSNAPPYPPNFSDDSVLAVYLKPQELVESDDPDIKAKALEVCHGSKDSWEAFTRLSKWVSDEISYDIPGGTTAKNTFKSRLGECGSHSRLLTAFSRSVGIPCRMVWGGMYIPERGGMFGQHAWNEVYMGEAGWIPVDATAEEIDFVDCGHIRIAEAKSVTIFFNAQEMEILEYKTADMGEGTQAVNAALQKYVGAYEGEKDKLTIQMKNNSLALQIPGRPLFELRDPDENGLCLFKITDKASVSFAEDDHGRVESMTVRSSTRIPRKIGSESGTDDGSIPEKYHDFLGEFTIPMQNKTIEVSFRAGRLELITPDLNRLRLAEPDMDSMWIAKVTDNTNLGVVFLRDDDGLVNAFNMVEISTFVRKKQ